MKKAFTLIELLVVVAIIGILATVVVVNVSSAQSKARDAKVKTEVGQAQLAANLYINNNNPLPFNCSTISTTACESLSGSSIDEVRDIARLSTEIKNTGSYGLNVAINADNTYQVSADIPSNPISAYIVGSATSVITGISNRILISPDVRNGGFERPGVDGSDVFAVWGEQVNPSGYSSINADSASPNTGAYACRFDVDPSSSYTVISVGGLLEATKKYRLTLYARVNNDSGVSQIASDMVSAPDKNITAALTTSYKKYTFEITNSASATFSLKRSGAAGKSIYIDDVTLEVLP